MPKSFDCLYLFENKETYILEVKRKDLPAAATKSEIYKWLLIDRETMTVTQLEFLALDYNDLTQERFFRQGYLSFDLQRAIYILESSSFQNILRTADSNQLPVELVLAVQDVVCSL